MFESAKDNPKPVVYPKLAQRINNLLRTGGARKIEISVKMEDVLKKETSIYLDSSVIEIVAHNGGWNLSADDHYIYEWKLGSREGIRIARDNDQLLQYIYYLTDPSWIMAGMYFEHTQFPETTVKRQLADDEAILEIVFNDPISLASS